MLSVILGAFILRDPRNMIYTITDMSTAMAVTGLWGTFWFITPFLVFGAVIVGFTGDRYLLLGLFTFPLIIPILGYLRGAPFHYGPGDSANRMLMHIVPLLVLVVIMGAGTAARALRDYTSAPGESPKLISDLGQNEQ